MTHELTPVSIFQQLATQQNKADGQAKFSTGSEGDFEIAVPVKNPEAVISLPMTVTMKRGSKPNEGTTLQLHTPPIKLSLLKNTAKSAGWLRGLDDLVQLIKAKFSPENKKDVAWQVTAALAKIAKYKTIEMQEGESVTRGIDNTLTAKLKLNDENHGTAEATVTLRGEGDDREIQIEGSQFVNIA